MLTVVLDTNVLVSSLSALSPYHAVIAHLRDGHYRMAISTEIFFEYEEQLTLKYGTNILSGFLSFISYSNNVFAVEPRFKFHLITNDKDDNKFVDCAVAANAHYLVTNDKHFNIMKLVNFPKVEIVTVERFIEILNELF